MIDSRVLIPQKVIKDLTENEALKQLLMTSWVDLHALKRIIFNAIIQEQPHFGGYYGNYRMTNNQFLLVIRKMFPESIIKRIGLFDTSNEQMINELVVIANFFNGNNLFI